jgi:hypothetical protein
MNKKKEVIMKRLKWLSLLAFMSLLVSSCSPVAHIETAPSADLRKYKTYAWVDTKASKDETGTSSTEFAKLSVHNAVNEQLQKKGWKLVNDDPDVLLTYDILVEKNVEQRNDPVFTQPFTRFFFNPYFNRWGTIYFPPRFMGYDVYQVPVKEATLTISMMDAKTDEKVWQGWTKQRVDSRLLSKNEIKTGVNSIFKKFDSAA